nr:hypothetical protein [Cupriavidus sp. IDO]
MTAFRLGGRPRMVVGGVVVVTMVMMTMPVVTVIVFVRMAMPMAVILRGRIVRNSVFRCRASHFFLSGWIALMPLKTL